MTLKINTDEAREALKSHKITWWVLAGDERIRRTSTMRGAWGFDATCTCGWDSRTGGALKNAVQRSVDDHKWDVQCDAETAAGR